VRNIIADPRYKSVFPAITLAQDSKSAGRWSTNAGGEYFATGVGAALAGRGADLLLVDDPHSEQDLLAGNFEELEKTYQWFAFGARTRLMSGGRIAVVHCMTGDTPVLMEDGSEKLLRELRPGDMVAGYREGALIPSRVLNWANQGPDRILTIKTTSGKILRANGKHPLLVDLDGVKTWVKVKNLKVGMSLIGVSQAPVADLNSHQNGSVFSPLERNLSDCLSVVKQSALSPLTHLGNVSTTTTKTVGKLKSSLNQTIGASGAALNVVWKGVKNLPAQKGCVYPTTTSTNGHWETTDVVRKKIETHTSSTGMVSALKNTIRGWLNKTVNALFVGAPLDQTTPLLTGKGNLGLTTATVGVQFEHYCATRATSLSVKGTQKKHSYGPLSTYEPILDQIVSITNGGYEEVFDIQVEGTENFIANGLVSHNTRWHQDDLIGHLIKDGANNPKADQYEVFEFPAILDTNSGPKALWPEKFDLDALERTKASMPLFQWNAQYMQNPTGEQGAIIQRDWWKPWKQDNPPQCDFVIMTLDAAAEKSTRADFTSLLTWGIFSDDNLTNGEPHIILMNAINVRVEFPELKDLAIREYHEWEPEAFIVEKKSNGTPLYQELRRMGIPVQEFTPHRGTGDKVARLSAVADIIRSGMVWYPEGRRWAEEVIEQCVAFPFGSHDDMVDCTSMALARFRQGGLISLSSDLRDPDALNRPRRAAYY
jgi:predicted phage terminase large subunit-like protein